MSAFAPAFPCGRVLFQKTPKAFLKPSRGSVEATLTLNSRVLLVDDNADHLSALAELLEGEYEVHVAPNGAEALAICEEHSPFALVLSDQEMPGMTGVELLARIGDRWPGTERILMSGKADSNVLVRAVNEARVFHFLLKPVSSEELRGVILHAVAHFQAGEEERLLTEQLSFARESLISMTETLEHRLALEMRRVRAIEDLGLGLVSVQSTDTISQLALDALARMFDGRAIRLVVQGSSYVAGETSLQSARDVTYWREPIYANGEELGEVFVETEDGGPSTTERRLLRLVCAFVSLAAQTRLHYGKSREAKLQAIRTLAYVAESNDDQTYEHHEHVGPICRLVAEEMRDNGRDGAVLTERFIEELDLAARLHDIGKAAIPESILEKAEPLSEEEWDVIRSHPALGAETLRQALESSGGEESSLRMAYEIVLHHHENWDGGGYPRGMRGETIPLSARIVAVADCYDALTSQRAYKDPWTHGDALAFVREESGGRFDPHVVEAFVARAEEIRALREDVRVRERRNRAS